MKGRIKEQGRAEKKKKETRTEKVCLLQVEGKKGLKNKNRGKLRR